MRLYLTASEVLESPLGVAISAQLGQLNTGVLEKMIARASMRCDTYCERRLQALGSTTLSANAFSGATSITVASTLTFDEREEQAVIINPGGATQETVDLSSVTTTGFTPTYPGTMTLSTPLVYGHSANEVVQGVYREVSQVGSASSSDPYSEALLLQSQDAQIAMAHLPPIRLSLTRVFFVKNYPIISLKDIQHAYSYNNAYHAVTLDVMAIVAQEGWFRANVGNVILNEGLLKTTYSGGYTTIPQDIKDATMYFLRDEVTAFVNPYGLVQQTMGKRSQTFRQGNMLSPNVLEAQNALNNYKRRV